MSKKYLRNISTAIATTGLGTLMVTGITGCENRTSYEEQQSQGAFVIIEEVSPGKYQIKDEFPADETRIVLKSIDGTERVLTQSELDQLVAEQNAKIDNGTSDLTNPNASASNGLGLGEILLSSMAGAMLGAWIGNKLFGNANYQNNRKASYKSPATYERSKNSFSKAKRSASSKKSGFFSNNKKSSRSSGFFGG